MRFFVGVTDLDWFRFLSDRPGIDEVNFWQPGGSRVFRALEPGELFLFKLKSPFNAIVGGGVLGFAEIFPLSLAWDAFEQKNGAATLAEMRGRIGRLRHTRVDPVKDYNIGCILLQQPFFLPETDWLRAPQDWSREIVSGKTYFTHEGEGRRIWTELTEHAPLAAMRGTPEPLPLTVGEPRFGQPTTVLPRLGQGSFRVLVTHIYDRRCAVTGERTLPVLQASHIKPVAVGGPYQARNGLLLRSDLHTLFDRGYVTVTPDRRFEVSRRIREEFENGREYYDMRGRVVRNPRGEDCAPAGAFLDWHASNVFRG